MVNLKALKDEMMIARANLFNIEMEFEKRYASVRAAIAKLDEEFGKANAELIKAKDEEAARAASLEQSLRSAVVAAYDANPDNGKQLGDGLSVQVRTKYEYGEADAVKWARENAPVMIVNAIDKKAFEAMIKGMKTMPDFVRVTTSTVAVIKE